MENSKIVQTICKAAHEKKAEEIVIMEMGVRSAFCDFFVVMSAPSTVRVKTIVDFIEDSLKEEGVRLLHREGYAEGSWVLLDFGGVIAHVFHGDIRHFYQLEHLWGDVPKRAYSG